jgi:hypothetical protein
MKTIVITQPMFFPWVGLLEQIRLADTLVIYDDAQFSKGGFLNRVQIKTAAGVRWLTVPLRDAPLGTRMMDAVLDDRKDWRRSHLDQLRQSYASAPHRNQMLSLVEQVYDKPYGTLDRLAEASMAALASYFEVSDTLRWVRMSDLCIPGKSWERVLSTVKALDGDVYVTGHGARNYMDHKAFEQAGVTVRYMDYARREYPQLHGEFTPYVSALDLIANCGKEGRSAITSGTVHWREFIEDAELELAA